MTKSKISVIDLFAGAGGLSCGFEAKDCEIVLAVEKDNWAANTYRENHRNDKIVEMDIACIGDEFFAAYCGSTDVVMGGPPCQGFSIAASNRRKKDDVRNELYKEFLRAVSIIKPRVVVIENVKEIVKFTLPDGTRVIDDIMRFFDKHGYIYDFSILNCRNYGIPQDRKRFFLLAVQKEQFKGFLNLEHRMSKYIQPELSFSEAISDLPVVKARQYAEDYVMEYTNRPLNAYQTLLRGECVGLANHIPMQHTDKTVEKFRFLLEARGESLPEELLPRVRSQRDKVSSASYGQNHRIINGEKVSPTITASFYSSFIHPTQPRNITVREAARIQSFPDSFVFRGKKTTLSKKLLARKGILEELHLDQFNQVGNAVPPLMAQHLAEICIELLTKGMSI